MTASRRAQVQPSKPDLTIVCCVEFGRLEEQTVLMVRSLRTFGGALSQVPVLAVIGRPGAPLRNGTLAEFKRLGVRVVHAGAGDNPARWLNYANKIAAVVVAERVAKTSQIAWFDSDMFVLREPSGIILRDDEALAAQCHHYPPAATEGDSTHDDYWKRVCELFDLDFSTVPWVESQGSLPRHKLNFTSGLFTWRRRSAFAGDYLAAVRRVLAARLAQSTGEFFTVDQVVLTPVVVGRQLRWRNLAREDHSIVLGPFLAAGSSDVPDFSLARVLHYSNSFATPYRAKMEERLQAQAPAFFEWLQRQDFDPGKAPLWSRIITALLKAARGLRYRVYERSTVRAG
jgi:hypothetical protein